MSTARNPTCPEPLEVRLRTSRRGQRAWHAWREKSGTLGGPSASPLAERSAGVGKANDKKVIPMGLKRGVRSSQSVRPTARESGGWKSRSPRDPGAISNKWV